MSRDANKNPIGFKLRFSPSARARAEEVARALNVPPVLELDNSLLGEKIELDVSYDDGEVERDASVDTFMG